MAKFIVRGGVPVGGRLRVTGSKNEALPVLAAALLTDEPCVFENVPVIDDTATMVELLAELGCDVAFDTAAHTVTVCARAIRSHAAPPELARRMRASFLVTGPLLARFGRAEAPHPGGCDLGSRPKNVDVKGFMLMGAQTELARGNYVFTTPALHGAKIYLDYPSHTGTENLLMAATLAKGTTVLKNACAEPEIDGLVECLTDMGARISGAGTSEIRIEGVDRLHGVRHRLKSDRLVAGTYALAGAITGGEVIIEDVAVAHLDPLTYKLQEVGVAVDDDDANYRYTVRRPANGPLHAVEVQTLHYPGFPTDLQAPFAALLTQAEGMSLIHERVFDNRLLYADELRRMGAQIDVRGEKASVTGPTRLHGASVRALDIRSGAAVILAALAAEGETEIRDAYHVERGYEDIAGTLRALGARIELVE